jgi:hypothetical protein
MWVRSHQTREGESIVGRYRSIPRYQSARFSHANLAANLIRMFGARARTTRMNDRRNSQPRDVLSFGPFTLFPAERLLKKADKPTALGGPARDILIALVERAGEVVTNEELISAVWPDVVVEKGNLRFQMATLRKAVDTGNHTSAVPVGLGLGKVIQLDGGYTLNIYAEAQPSLYRSGVGAPNYHHPSRPSAVGR